MQEEYLNTLESKINEKIAEKLALEQELETLRIEIISKGAENLNLKSICNSLEAKRQELETANVVSTNTHSQYMAKIKDLKSELEVYHASLKEYDLLKLKLLEIQSAIETDNHILSDLHQQKGSLDAEIRNMRDEWGRLKRENDKYDGICAKLATAEMNEDNIRRKIDELKTKEIEIAGQAKIVEERAKEFISNPLSIGYYIKFLQKRLDNGELKNIFDAIKQAS